MNGSDIMIKCDLLLVLHRNLLAYRRKRVVAHMGISILELSERFKRASRAIDESMPTFRELADRLREYASLNPVKK